MGSLGLTRKERREKMPVTVRNIFDEAVKLLITSQLLSSFLKFLISQVMKSDVCCCVPKSTGHCLQDKQLCHYLSCKMN